MTYYEAEKELEAEFKLANLPEPNADALLLIREAAGFSLAQLLMNKNNDIPEGVLKKLLEYKNRRLKREPVQYILGVQNFMGFDFKVTPDCLIPRFDTEILVEETLKELKRYPKGADVIDICTGTGCIITSLKKLGNVKRACACDISDAALKVARENADALEAEVEFFKSDLYSEVDGKFDIIVSNPPYICTEIIKGLEPEVRSFEPMLALDGGSDGMFFYRKLIENASDYLKNEGYILLEICEELAEEVQKLLIEHCFTEVKIVKDLAGLNRVAKGRLIKG